jgi:hypothetical protein
MVTRMNYGYTICYQVYISILTFMRWRQW